MLLRSIKLQMRTTVPCKCGGNQNVSGIVIVVQAERVGNVDLEQKITKRMKIIIAGYSASH